MLDSLPGGETGFGSEDTKKGCPRAAFVYVWKRYLHTLFTDTSGFSTQTAQVVQLGATDYTAAHDFDFLNVGRGEREDTLYTDLVADLANGEAGTGAASATGDAYALELLDTLLVAFLDTNVNVYRITCLEIGHIVPHIFGFYQFDQVFHYFLIYAYSNSGLQI